jgi:hypothetical protein
MVEVTGISGRHPFNKKNIQAATGQTKYDIPLLLKFTFQLLIILGSKKQTHVI